MKINSSLLLLSLALAGCTAPSTPFVAVSSANVSAPTQAPSAAPTVARPTVAPVTPPSHTAMPQPTVASAPAGPAVLANPDVIRVLDDLKQRGISVGEPHESRAAFLYPVEGAAYTFAQGWLHIHPHANAQAAEERASQIPSELARSIADWIAPLHYFRCQSVIALYLGSDIQVMQALTDLCGPEFASTGG